MNQDKQITLKRNRSKNGGNPDFYDYMIQLNMVEKVYLMGGSSFTALRGVNLKIEKGEFVSVIGKSGSGKSTLLNMITGIDRPTSGEVIVAGTPIHNLNEGKMAVWRGRHLGIVFQFFQLLPTLTILENILLPMDFSKKFSVKERRERAMSLLEEVDLVDQAGKLPATLSGGQQQRIAIVRALANDPSLIVADEPTGNLDTKTAESIFQLFNKLVSQGKTILTVTHDQDLAQNASRIIHIQDGEITEDLNQFRNDEVEQWIQDTGRNVQIDLVKSGISVKTKESSQERQSSISENDYDGRVLKILENQENAMKLLRDEFFKVSHNDRQMENLYSSVVRQVQILVDTADSENKNNEAKRLWKIVMDATEPWAKKIESDQ